MAKLLPSTNAVPFKVAQREANPTKFLPYARHLNEDMVALDSGNVMLHPKPDVGILIERAVAGGLAVRSVKRNRLVAVLFGELDAAIKIAVFDIAPPENDQAGFQNLLVDDERHSHTPLCRNCAGLERKRAEFHNCAGAV